MRAILVASALWALAVPVRAQGRGLRGYALDVAAWSDSGAAGPGGGYELARFRLMAAPRLGRVRADVAWETYATLTTRSGAALAAGGLAAPSGGEWLPLQGRLARGAHGEWRHRADRLAVHYDAGPLEVAVGRQAVSWATTLLFTPADPFAPFDPSDPFREYRAGVDAVRVRVMPAPLAEIDAVLRVEERPAGRTVTGGVRAKNAFGPLELAGWGGVVADDPAGSAAATLALGGAVLRGEIVVRRVAGATVERHALGVDRSVELAGRTLYAALEWQHDGFGARLASALPAVATSAAAGRGELQALGRDEAAVQASYQVHPLVSVELLSLVNLRDGSALLAPALGWSATSFLAVRAGLFAGAGRSGPVAAPRSEYGLVPRTAYAAVSAFF